MTRVKRSVHARKKRRSTLKEAKGYWGRKKSSYRFAKEQVARSGAYAYRDRRNKKREMRSLWLVRLNAGLREQGLSYSKFSGMLTKANIKLDRKVLSELAADHPAVFKALVETVSKLASK